MQASVKSLFVLMCQYHPGPEDFTWTSQKSEYEGTEKMTRTGPGYREWQRTGAITVTSPPH